MRVDLPIFSHISKRMKSTPTFYSFLKSICTISISILVVYIVLGQFQTSKELYKDFFKFHLLLENAIQLVKQKQLWVYSQFLSHGLYVTFFGSMDQQ